jgi:hypothetical protein
MKLGDSKFTEYRRRAAEKIREARRADNDRDRMDKFQIAMGYKALAAAEEWLASANPKELSGREPKR